MNELTNAIDNSIIQVRKLEDYITRNGNDDSKILLADLIVAIAAIKNASVDLQQKIQNL